MRTTVTPKQRVLATLVKWTSLFLILLAVMAGTISGELPIGRTNLSRTSSVLSSLNSHCPDATPDQTPTPIQGGCAYIPITTGHCTSSYTFQNGICQAAPINDNNPHDNQPVPPNLAPPTESINGCLGGFQPVTINGATECQIIGGRGTIDPSCSPGYVNVNDKCFSNAPFDLGDASNGNCTLTPQGEEGEGSGEESGNEIYWCPYTKGQLRCVITGTSEQCTMTTNNAVVGFFTCQGLNAGYPTSCVYLGTGGTTKRASSTCHMGSCTIIACWDTSTQLFIAEIGASCPSQPDKIQVIIQEKCTPQVDGQRRVCDYDSTGGKSRKTVTLSISCDASQTDTTDLICSVTDPYGVVFNKQCVNTQENQDDQATCTISQLWIEQCRSTTNSSTIPDCMVMTSDNLTLGTLHCDSASSCTIKDADGTNTINLSCAGLCHSDTPDCPHPVVPSATAITEATIACDAKLVADMLMYGSGAGPKKHSIVTPLSQIEIEFVLQRIGAGSQTWFPDPNLPAEVAL